MAPQINETAFGQRSSIHFYTWTFHSVMRTHNSAFSLACFSDWSFTVYGVLGGGWQISIYVSVKQAKHAMKDCCEIWF